MKLQRFCLNKLTYCSSTVYRKISRTRLDVIKLKIRQLNIETQVEIHRLEKETMQLQTQIDRLKQEAMNKKCELEQSNSLLYEGFSYKSIECYKNILKIKPTHELAKKYRYY
jgi:hypothetical protein